MEYVVVGHRTLTDSEGNEVLCEVREFVGMTDVEVEDMMQEMSFINENGEVEYQDLRYL